MSVQGPTAAAPTVTEEPGASAAAAAAARKRQASVVDEGAIPKPQQHSKQQQQPPQQLISVDVAGILLQFAKTFVIIFPVYALGYLGLSFSWVLVGLFFFFWWQRNRGNKRSRLSRALAFLEHEDTFREEIKSSDLPSWVHFPDVERVEWINKTVKHMWPYICQFVEKLLKETIEPAVRGANSHLSTFSFTKINLGDKPLRINGVKTYTENVDNRQIILDLQISYVGNSEIDLEIKRYFCRAGVKSIQLNGIIRVILEPLLGDMPLIGALSFFFLRRPLLEINWTGLTNLLDIPGLNGMSNTIILDIISNYLVLPNRITVPLVDEVQLAQLRFPIPKGFLRIHFIEAQDLEWKDTFMKGLVKGKSDPYGILRVGNQMFQSKTIKENLNPRWNEVYEALVYESPGQELEIELFDEDPDKDDFLDLDCWFDLEEVSRGKLHLKLEWLSLLPTPEKLTEIRYRTTEPVWEEAFTFFVHNPQTQELDVEIKDDHHQCSLGSYNLRLEQLLEAEDLTLNQRFQLKHSGPNSTLKMKIVLRVCTMICLASDAFQNTLQYIKKLEKTDKLEKESASSPSPQRPTSLQRTPSGHTSSSQTGSPSHLSNKEPTPSIASDISLPFATQELRQRLRQLQNNLIAFSEDGSDPYARLYLLPDKRRSGRRKTSVLKKQLNPVYDETFEFSVSQAEVQKRTLDVAVKNSGGFLSRDKGLLGKVSVTFSHSFPYFILFYFHLQRTLKPWPLPTYA
uniref:Extended synaptotagmin 2 n=1 Tax=Callorhinchus milii TaxID=7868 RepID=A0A4W3GKF2_CALMI